MQRLVFGSLAVAVVACAGQVTQARQGYQATTARPKISYANIGGYLLAYECTGTGRLTVILEAGYTASGKSGLPPPDTRAACGSPSRCPRLRTSPTRSPSPLRIPGAGSARRQSRLLAEWLP